MVLMFALSQRIVCRPAAFLRNPDGSRLYDHVEVADLEWQCRRDRLLKEFALLAPDVICLQEVEFATFEQELAPALKALGYDGVMQDDVKRAPKQSTGNATFHRADALTLQWTEHRSRSLITEYVAVPEGQLSTASGPFSVTVGNVHLQGDPERGDLRLAQFKSVEKTMAKRRRAAAGAGSRFAAVVVGDLNEDPSELSSPIGMLVSGAPPMRRMASVQANHRVPTFVLPGRQFELDHLMLVDGEAELHAVADFACEVDEWATVLRRGLPNTVFASDHVPIAANFSAVGLPASDVAKAPSAPQTIDELWEM
jgi:mRNA deadenylase 3'-5' endonuclease subunit Ccr4